MSSLAKIVYPSGGGTTLLFARPPRNVPYYEGEPVRHDDYSSYGDHVSFAERIDHFLSFDMPLINDGTDAANWRAFLDWAAEGANFDYYPDYTSGTYTTYHALGGRKKLEPKAPGLWKLTGLEFRQVIA
jgi:hypothetical protein